MACSVLIINRDEKMQMRRSRWTGYVPSLSSDESRFSRPGEKRKANSRTELDYWIIRKETRITKLAVRGMNGGRLRGRAA